MVESDSLTDVRLENNSAANTTNKHATLIHEAGHTFSMAHCSHKGKKHIMHQGLKDYTTVSEYEKTVLSSRMQRIVRRFQLFMRRERWKWKRFMTKITL